VEKAFKHLEREVDAGRIQYYGISSAALAEPSTSNTHIALQHIVDIAKRGIPTFLFSLPSYVIK